MPVHSDIESVISHIQTNLGSAEAITRGLTKEQFNWRPEPGRWSIGQCIQHLNLINGADISRLDNVVADARAKGLTATGPFQYGWFSRKFIRSVDPPVTRKFRAPKAYEPPPGVEVEVTMAEFVRISNEIIRVARSARGLNLSKIKTGLSGVPVIKMPLGARLSLLASHDTRHLWQADQVLRTAGFPK